MTMLQIPITPEAEGRLALRAAASGVDLPSYVAKLVNHFAEPPTPLEELSGPIHQRFLESGMTDDELSELLEKTKHQMRAERRAGARWLVTRDRDLLDLMKDAEFKSRFPGLTIVEPPVFLKEIEAAFAPPERPLRE